MYGSAFLRSRFERTTRLCLNSTHRKVTTKPRHKTLSMPRTRADNLEAGWRDDDPLSWNINRDKTNKVKFSSDHIPDRFELFLLDDGQQKVEYKEETRKSSVHLSTNSANESRQVYPTLLSSHSTRRIIHLATSSPSAYSSTITSSSPPTKFPTRSSRPSSSASKPMAQSHQRRLSFGAARILSRICMS